MSTAVDAAKPNRRCRCDNCEAVCTERELGVIANLQERVDPGYETPAGECRKCGALSYLIERPDPLPIPNYTGYLLKYKKQYLRVRAYKRGLAQARSNPLNASSYVTAEQAADVASLIKMVDQSAVKKGDVWVVELTMEPLRERLLGATGNLKSEFVELENGFTLQSGWIDKDDPNALPAGDYLSVLDRQGQQVFYVETADLIADPILCRQKLCEMMQICAGK